MKSGVPRIRDGWLGRVLRGVEGERAGEDDGGSRWIYTGDRGVESRGRRRVVEEGWWSGWLVGDALRELPAARSRDSYPRPIIDRSPEERRTRCTHQALYLALYQFSEDILKAKIVTGGGGEGWWTKDVSPRPLTISCLDEKFYFPRDLFLAITLAIV